MTKVELINKVQKKVGNGASRRLVEQVLKASFDEIGKSIKKEKRFSYAGFGTFTVRHRKARKGVNPQTKQPLTIKASKTVGFKPSSSLKQSL